MSSTPIANNSLVTPAIAGSASSSGQAPLYAAAPIAGVPPSLYGSTTTAAISNSHSTTATATVATCNEPLYSSSSSPANTIDMSAVVAVQINSPDDASPQQQVAAPSTFHDATIESARSTLIKLGIVEAIIGGSLFGVMMWTYQSARVAGQMSLMLGIILLSHSASKTAPLMRNKAYGGCCAQTCPWKILRILCIVTSIINLCSAVAMTILAILSFTVWSDLSEDETDNLMTKICCSVGAVLSLVSGILAWKACRPCTTINERLATLVASGVLVVSFEHMWCNHPYLAPVVVSNNSAATPSAVNTNSSQLQMAVVTTGVAVVEAQPQPAETSSSFSSGSWNSGAACTFHQVEVQPAIPMQEEEVVEGWTPAGKQ